mmetsp:Transcript_102813/g.331731  ORF Transcript_102813/g.331731 Transcript_102813/m.331731 type:complete len:144 (-) Transcript_102813:8-439(-)
MASSRWPEPEEALEQEPLELPAESVEHLDAAAVELSEARPVDGEAGLSGNAAWATSNSTSREALRGRRLLGAGWAGGAGTLLDMRLGPRAEAMSPSSCPCRHSASGLSLSCTSSDSSPVAVLGVACMAPATLEAGRGAAHVPS